MQVIFDDKDLEELITTGRNSKYKKYTRNQKFIRNENPAPFMAVHPGMMIKPELDERGISQKEFAKMLGIQPSHLSEVLNGKRALTTELAVKIENAIGLPAKILLSAQTQYELESTVEDNQHETISVTIPVRDRNLLQELVRKFGWACVL